MVLGDQKRLISACSLFTLSLCVLCICLFVCVCVSVCVCMVMFVCFGLFVGSLFAMIKEMSPEEMRHAFCGKPTVSAKEILKAVSYKHALGASDRGFFEEMVHYWERNSPENLTHFIRFLTGLPSSACRLRPDPQLFFMWHSLFSFCMSLLLFFLLCSTPTPAGGHERASENTRLFFMGVFLAHVSSVHEHGLSLSHTHTHNVFLFLCVLS